MAGDACSKPDVMRFFRSALLILPALTVAIVMFSIFVAGVERPYRAARLYGGPTEGARTLAFRLEVVERLGDREAPAGAGEVRVQVLGNGRALGQWQGRLAGPDPVEVGIALGGPVTGPLEVRVLDPSGERLLGQGQVYLSRARWQASQRQRGGWLPGRSRGALELSAAPGRGVFAVPFADPFWVEVRRAGRLLAGATVDVRIGGGDVSPSRRITDERGRAAFMVLPREHAATAEIRAQTADGAAGELRVAVPVVPGALHATSTDRGIVIEAPVQREVAYYSLVDREGRHGGGAARLEPASDGGSRALLEPFELERRPLWMVLSSSPDLRSEAAVGWPLASSGEDPPRTLDVYDHLLLDGAKLGFSREQQRLRRVRWTTAALCAVALALSIALLIARARNADRQIAAHLREAGLAGEVERLAPSRAWWLVVASLSVLLGFLVLALVVLYRVR